MTTTILAFIPSPSQGVWHLFGVLPIRAYALCIIAGIIAALVIGDRRWEARGGERGVIYDVALWAVPFGLIGGRLYHVMTDWPKYFGADGAGFLAALRIWDGGLGIWGAVALGGVGAWIACRRHGIPLPAFGDAIAPGIILAQAIGRLGNYFNQELYGRETDLPWGLTIWERLDPSGVVSPHSLDGVSTGQVYAVVHPTFLYELLWNLLIFAMLIWVDRRFKIGHGRLFALYVAGYCVGRFWVELMRSDSATLIAGIRINTFTSSFVFIAAVIYLMVAPKGREDPATLRGNAVVHDDESALDELGEELAAVAATSGLVAAAKVAGDEDEGPLASANTGGAADDASEAQDDGVEAESSADDLAVEPAFDGAEEAPDVAPVAPEGTEVAEALNAEVEPEDTDSEPESTDGLGSVDGAEVVAAEEAAPEVHAAAAENAEAAQATADEAETEVTEESTGGLGSVDGDDIAAAEEAAPEVHDDTAVGAVDAEALAEDATTADSTDGRGSVDGAESSEADEATPEVHNAAIEDPEAAEAPADEVAVAEAEEDATAENEEPAAVTEESAGGLGSVEGAEVTETQSEAAEVHEAAVTGADDAEALAVDVATEPAPDDATATPKEGQGSAGGAEVSATEEAAPEIREATATPEATATKGDEPRRPWWRRG